MRKANEERAVEKAGRIPHNVELVKRLAPSGAIFRVSYPGRSGTVRRYSETAGRNLNYSTPTTATADVRWPTNFPSDWRQARCSCKWGSSGGRGCWHVHAVRLEWMRRNEERHEARKAGIDPNEDGFNERWAAYKREYALREQEQERMAFEREIQNDRNRRCYRAQGDWR